MTNESSSLAALLHESCMRLCTTYVYHSSHQRASTHVLERCHMYYGKYDYPRVDDCPLLLCTYVRDGE